MTVFKRSLMLMLGVVVMMPLMLFAPLPARGAIIPLTEGAPGPIALAGNVIAGDALLCESFNLANVCNPSDIIRFQDTGTAVPGGAPTGIAKTVELVSDADFHVFAPKADKGFLPLQAKTAVICAGPLFPGDCLEGVVLKTERVPGYNPLTGDPGFPDVASGNLNGPDVFGVESDCSSDGCSCTGNVCVAPEPTSLMLFGLGLACAGAVTSLRRRSTR